MAPEKCLFRSLSLNVIKGVGTAYSCFVHVQHLKGTFWLCLWVRSCHRDGREGKIASHMLKWPMYFCAKAQFASVFLLCLVCPTNTF